MAARCLGGIGDNSSFLSEEEKERKGDAKHSTGMEEEEGEAENENEDEDEDEDESKDGASKA